MQGGSTGPGPAGLQQMPNDVQAAGNRLLAFAVHIIILKHPLPLHQAAVRPTLRQRCSWGSAVLTVSCRHTLGPSASTREQGPPSSEGVKQRCISCGSCMHVLPLRSRLRRRWQQAGGATLAAVRRPFCPTAGRRVRLNLF